MNVQADIIADSIRKAWGDQDKRLAYMLQALVYAIAKNTANLEAIRKTLESYD